MGDYLKGEIPDPEDVIPTQRRILLQLDVDCLSTEIEVDPELFTRPVIGVARAIGPEVEQVKVGDVVVPLKWCGVDPVIPDKRRLQGERWVLVDEREIVGIYQGTEVRDSRFWVDKEAAKKVLEEEAEECPAVAE